MSMINWSTNLSVNINSIDNQHKKLIDLINSFYDNINQGSPKAKMLELITALKEYTVYHFSTEEKLMKQFNYPDYVSHKSEHDKFVSSVFSFEERYNTGKLLLSLEITSFIKDWVAKHIMGTDKKYSDFFISKGVK